MNTSRYHINSKSWVERLKKRGETLVDVSSRKKAHEAAFLINYGFLVFKITNGNIYKLLYLPRLRLRERNETWLNELLEFDGISFSA